MRIVLSGGGSGGHLTPLLAVARELKALDPTVEIHAVCDKGGRFNKLLYDEPAINEVHEITAGKIRRYPGESWLRRLTDFRTIFFNLRDSVFIVMGLFQAKSLIKRLQPDGVFVKGSFAALPVGVAAGRRHIPIVTHDSDSMPGLTNRLIARWATKHATGMEAKFYSYPKEKTVFTGVPVSADYVPVTAKLRDEYRAAVDLAECSEVVLVTGGSLGGSELNDTFSGIVSRLMQLRPGLGILHITGQPNEAEITRYYQEELLADELRRVNVKGFVSDLYKYSGAADVVVTRAGATSLTEFGIQGLTCIVVPGQLAGDHQGVNARNYASEKAVVVVKREDPDDMFNQIVRLLDDKKTRLNLAENLQKITPNDASEAIAKLLLSTFGPAE